MNIADVINGRKTVRKFDSYVLNDEEIKTIINSARLAPSAMNTQNWRFIAVINQEIKEKMAKAVLSAYDDIISRISKETAEKVERFKGHSTFFTKAPLVIVCIETNAPAFMEGVLEEAHYSIEEIKTMRPNSYLLSMGAAIENMLLTAYSMGFGSCWMVAPVLGAYDMKKVLNLKEGEKIVSILSIGKPSPDISENRSPKKNLEEIIEIIK